MKQLLENSDYIEELGFSEELANLANTANYKKLGNLLRSQDLLVGDSEEKWAFDWQDEQDMQDSFEDLIESEKNLLKKLQRAKSKKAKATLAIVQQIVNLWGKMNTKKVTTHNSKGREEVSVIS